MDSTLGALPRYWRTIRHLQPSQVGWRVRYLVERRLERQRWYDVQRRWNRRFDLAPAEIPPPHFLKSAIHGRPAMDRLSELRSGYLTLLNEQRPFTGGSDWRNLESGGTHRLWNFSLHYHSWLTDLAVEYACSRNNACLTELRRWLLDWLENCAIGTPGFAQGPWNSFNIGARLWEWHQIDRLVPRSFWNAQLPRSRFLQSVAQQTNYLAQHIEWDLRGNHLFKDAVGLAVGASLVDHPAADRWRSQAEELAVSQLREQILPDGVHFERSPMYQIHVMEDLLAIEQLLRGPSMQIPLRESLNSMAAAVRWLQHPCGRYPLFNDAADHAVPRPDAMLAELRERKLLDAEVEPFGLKFFEQAGLAAWQSPQWTVFFDMGPIGPAYQPGHAHADNLNLELSYEGLPLIVDPGTVCYDHDARRRYDRSTDAHNTICLNHADSSEVWHIFRVGRRAEPVDVSVHGVQDGFHAVASHTGYDHHPGSPRHRRSVRLTLDALQIDDEITGSGHQQARGGFLLDPQWQAETTPTGWKLLHRQCRILVELHSNQPVTTEIVSRPWHPEFGREILTQRLQWSGNIIPPFRLSTRWRRG